MVCRPPTLDPWLGALWTHGHSHRLSALSCGTAGIGCSAQGNEIRLHQRISGQNKIDNAHGCMADSGSDSASHVHDHMPGLPASSVDELSEVLAQSLPEASATLVRFITCADKRCFP
jgi:hypothetical protein